MTPVLYDGAISFLAALPPAGVKLRPIFVDRQYTPAPMHQTTDDIPRCAVLPHADGGCAYIVLCATAAGATRLLMSATQPQAFGRQRQSGLVIAQAILGIQLQPPSGGHS